MSARTFQAYYPDRFVAARFYDPQTKQIRTADVRQDDEDSGLHLAAVGAKRARTDDEEDEGAPSSALAALQLSERRNEQQRYTKRDVARIVARMRQSSAALVLRSQPVQAGNPNIIHRTQERPWLLYEVLLVQEIAVQVPMVAACISALKNLVMSDGIKFMRENVELIPSRDFQDYVVRHLNPFAYACIDALLMLGIIPVVYELDERTGQRWPYVPAIGTYIIKRHTVRGAVRYNFYWTDEASFRQAWQRQAIRVRDATGIRWTARRSCEDYLLNNDEDLSGGIYDPYVEVIHNLGHELTQTGALTSKLASLLGVAYNRMRMQKARATAETNAAAPPFATEYDHAAEAHQSKSLAQGYYASAAAPPDVAGDPESIEAHTYQRDAAQKENYLAMLREYESMTGRDAGDVFDVPHELYRSDLGGTSVTQNAKTSEGVAAPWGNTYHVSAARKLAKLPDAHMSTDYVNALRYMDEEICGVMGVPQTYVLGTALRAGTELVTNRLHDEVGALKNKLSDVVTHIYGAIWLGEDISSYMSSELRQQTLRVGIPDEGAQDEPSPLLTPDDLFVIDAIKRVRATFSKQPSENPQELIQMFALGFLPQHILCTEMARRNNFIPSQMCSPDELEEMPMEMRQWLIPELAEYHKQQQAVEQHKDEMKMQKDQAKQDGAMKDKEIKSKEKQAKMNVDVKKAAVAAKPKSSSSSSSGGGGATKTAKAAPSKPEPISGPSLSAISKAASTLAAAGAAIKRQKQAAEGGKKEGGESK